MKNEKIYIIKESGEKEIFNIDKLITSLKKSGTPIQLIKEILQKIEARVPFRSTKEIYRLAYSFLQKHHRGAAGRYNLKRAIMELGPSGYPFEKFVGAIFKAKGFSVQLNVIVQGTCVSHELDAMGTKNKKHFLIECKYHNRSGLKTDVRVPLYIKARFDDLEATLKNKSKDQQDFYQAMIVTNTKFTSNAIQYAKCVHIKLMGWTYPKKENVVNLIDKFHLHPITTLTTLTTKQKKDLLKKGIILCSEVKKNKASLKDLSLSDRGIEKIISEAEAICELKK